MSNKVFKFNVKCEVEVTTDVVSNIAESTTEVFNVGDKIDVDVIEMFDEFDKLNNIVCMIEVQFGDGSIAVIPSSVLDTVN